MNRVDGRTPAELRPIDIQCNYILYPEGSVLISMGNTKVLCNATLEEGVPRWMGAAEQGRGWITGEYALLPRSTAKRTSRETNGIRGRTHEIKRLIGRALRQAVDLKLLGERTVTIDCDVLQADGGTRTAAVTGGYLALRLALEKLIIAGTIPRETLREQIAAISVGLLKGRPLLDLCYSEDSQADLDANIVMTSSGRFVEIQCTAEKEPLTRTQFDEVLSLAEGGLREIFLLQQKALQSTLC